MLVEWEVVSSSSTMSGLVMRCWVGVESGGGVGFCAYGEGAGLVMGGGEGEEGVPVLSSVVWSREVCCGWWSGVPNGVELWDELVCCSSVEDVDFPERQEERLERGVS